MPVAADDVIKVSAVMKDQFSGDVVNAFHIQVQGVTVGLDSAWEEFIAVELDALYTEINLGVSSTVLYDRIEIYNVTQDRPMLTQDWPVLTVGGAGGDALPTGVCGLILGRTGIKRRVGKKYLPPAGEGNLTAGVWNAGYMTLMETFADYWRTTATDIGVGSFNYGVVNALGGSFARIATATPSQYPAYQRRRRPGRGS